MSTPKVGLRPTRSNLLNHSLGILVWVVVISAIRQTDSDRYPIVKNDKVGFIDQGGNEVIAPQFFPIADMQHFREGLAPVLSPKGQDTLMSLADLSSGRHKNGDNRGFFTRVLQVCSSGAKMGQETQLDLLIGVAAWSSQAPM